jgi:hypothetical protein
MNVNAVQRRPRVQAVPRFLRPCPIFTFFNKEEFSQNSLFERVQPVKGIYEGSL